MFKRIATGKAWSTFLGGKLTFGASANTKSANLVLSPYQVLSSPGFPSDFCSVSHLHHSCSLIWAFSFFHLSILKQKKGFVVTGKNLLMLNQKDFTSLTGIFNV